MLQAETLATNAQKWGESMVKKKIVKKRGKKQKYNYWITNEGLALLEGWSREGYTDDEMANKIGINRATFYKWKKKYSIIYDAIKNNKEVSNYKVENSAFKNSTGFHYVEEQPFKVKKTYYNDQGKKVEEEEVKLVEVKKYQPPNPTNQFFFLKNRMPDKWKDKQEVNLETKTPLEVILKTVEGENY